MKLRIVIILLVLLAILGCKPGQSIPPLAVDSVKTKTPNWFMAGKVEAKDKADIISTFTARILKINKDVGQTVAKGAALVSLDRKEIQTQTDALQKNYDTAALNQTRSRALFENKVISEQQKEQAELQYNQAKAALELSRTQYENGTLVAPLDGVVTAVNVKTGEIATAGMVLLSIVNTTGIFVYAYIPESLMAEVTTGMPVLLKISELGDKIYHGKVSLVNSMVDTKSRTTMVKIIPSDFDSAVKPGMTVLVGKETTGAAK